MLDPNPRIQHADGSVILSAWNRKKSIPSCMQSQQTMGEDHGSWSVFAFKMSAALTQYSIDALGIENVKR